METARIELVVSTEALLCARSSTESFATVPFAEPFLEAGLEPLADPDPFVVSLLGVCRKVFEGETCDESRFGDDCRGVGGPEDANVEAR